MATGREAPTRAGRYLTQPTSYRPLVAAPGEFQGLHLWHPHSLPVQNVGSSANALFDRESAKNPGRGWGTYGGTIAGLRASSSAPNADRTHNEPSTLPLY